MSKVNQNIEEVVNVNELVEEVEETTATQTVEVKQASRRKSPATNTGAESATKNIVKEEEAKDVSELLKSNKTATATKVSSKVSDNEKLNAIIDNALAEEAITKSEALTMKKSIESFAKGNVSLNNYPLVVELARKCIDYSKVAIQKLSLSGNEIVPSISEAPINAAYGAKPRNLRLFGITGARKTTHAINEVIVLHFNTENGDGVAKLARLVDSEDGKDCHIYVRRTKDEITILYPKYDMYGENIEGYVDFKTNKFIELGKINKSYMKYFANGAGASGSRKMDYYFVKDTQMVLDKEQEWFPGYNEILGDALGTQADAAKVMARRFHTHTAHANLMSLRNFAIFTGKIADGGGDGSEFYFDQFMSLALEGAIKNVLGIDVKIPANVLNGESAQTRPALMKSQGIFINRLQMVSAIKKLEKQGFPIVVVNKSEMTAQKSAEVLSLKDTLVVVTEDGEFNDQTNIDLLTDMNATKGLFDLSANLPVRLLKLVKDGKQATGSVQLFFKILDSVKGRNHVKFLMESHIEKSIKKYSKAFAEGTFATEKDLNTSNLAGVLNRTFPEEVVQSLPALELKVTKALFTELSEQISKYKFAINAKFKVVAPDPGLIFSLIEIMGENEVFCNDPVFAKLVEIMAIRYPSPSFFERVLLKVITLKDVKARTKAAVDAGTITKKEKSAIDTYFANCGVSKIITSNSDNIKDILGGADMDTDTFLCIYDKVMIDCMKDVPSIAMKADNSEDMAKVVKEANRVMGVKGAASVINDALRVQTMSIGQITYFQEIVASVRFMDNKEEACKALTRIFDGDEVKTTRVNGYRPFSLKPAGMFEKAVVTSARARKCLEQVSTTTIITPKNLPYILRDLDSVFSYLQNATIDAPKTGFNPKVSINLSAQSLVHAKIMFNYNENGMPAYEVIEQNSDKITLGHPLHDIRIEGLNKIVEHFSKEITRIKAKLNNGKFKNATEDFLGQNKLNNKVDLSKLVLSFKVFRNVYASIVGEHMKELEAINQIVKADKLSNDVRKDMEQQANREKSRRLTALVQTVRLSTPFMSTIERGYAVIQFSTISFSGLSRDDWGTAFYTIFPAETFAALDHLSRAGFKNAPGIVGEEIMHLNKAENLLQDGDIVGFDSFGYSDAEVLPSLNLRGEYRALRRGEKVYATRTIEEAMVNIEEENINKARSAKEFIVPLKNVSFDERKALAAVLNESSRVIITANPKNGDAIWTEDGKFLSSVVLDLVSSDYIAHINNKVFEVDFVITDDVRSGRGVTLGVVGTGEANEVKLLTKEQVKAALKLAETKAKASRRKTIETEKPSPEATEEGGRELDLLDLEEEI